MENSKTGIWYSGDWKSVNSDVVPYNGVTISATACYSSETSPPTSMSLIYVDVVVTDHTYNPAGVASTVRLFKSDTIYYIPIPVDDTVSPPHPNAQFTVVSIKGNGHGELSLVSSSGGLYLSIQFSYGPQYQLCEQIGYIMKFLPTYSDDVKVIIVEA